MANNCYNYIFINGDKEEITKFFQENNIEAETNGGELYQKLRLKYGTSGNDARWFDILATKDSDENITITGDSAWTPCLTLITNISKNFPSFDIRYEYEESGCDFAGYATIQNGNCEDNCFDYWHGIFEINGDVDAMDLIICNELHIYETEEELKEASFWEVLNEEQKTEILEEWNNQK